MAASPPRRRASPPALPDELVEEILLRLPPDEPAWLLRASLVCKAWGGVVSHSSFRRRLHDLHRTAPMLGFLHNWRERTGSIPNFIPTTASAFSLAAPDRRIWRALDCRHGRALFFSKGHWNPEEGEESLPWEPVTDTQQELLVWEPITGAQQHIPVPAAFRSGRPGAAVFCAVDGCDHRDCQGGPFRVVFVFSVIFGQYDDREDEYITSACVYSSETGAWGELTSHSDLDMDFTFSSTRVLVGRSLFYFLSDSAKILEYDLARHGLSVIDPPDSPEYYDERFNLMLAEDGGLGVTEAWDPPLKLWSRQASDGADARWVLSRIIKLENFLPNDALVESSGYLYVLGFAEGANVIFLNTSVGLFMIELPSERVTKVCDDRGLCNLIPVVSFYTPLPRIKHHGRPSLNPSDEATCKERGGEEEKAVEQTQQLFKNGPRAVEEGDSLNACFIHDLETRVSQYEEVTLEGGATTPNRYECTLVPKDQEAINPSGDAPTPESVPNEGSMKGTSSKDDARNSTTSDSND